MSKLIEQLAEQLGASYTYNDEGRINLTADKLKKWPLVAEFIPAAGNFDTKLAPVIRTRRDTIVAFLVPCDLDFEGATIAPQIELMTQYAAKFLNAYIAAGYELPDIVAYNIVLDYLDKNLTGVRVTLPYIDNGACANG